MSVNVRSITAKRFRRVEPDPANFRCSRNLDQNFLACAGRLVHQKLRDRNSDRAPLRMKWFNRREAPDTLENPSSADSSTNARGPALELEPSLAGVVAAEQLDAAGLTVILGASDQGRIRVLDRRRLLLHQGGKTCVWQTESLRRLFRGDRRPPADINHYPPEYVPYFFFIERHIGLLCDALGDRTDQELEEIFSALRRRPDGRSLGPEHDFLWQVAALMLAKHMTSQAEFEAIFSQLENSARGWGIAPVSRNYLGFLRQGVLRRSDHS